MAKKLQDNKKLLIIYGLFFLGFALLAYLVPYSHDDWAWGSSIGIERLESFFVDYNGRYFGNFLILAITRSRFLWIISIAVAASLMCLLPSLFSGKCTVLSAVFSAVMFFLMPKEIFSQTIVWASGYSNYLPPILTTVIYFVLIRNIFDGKKPEYKRFLPVITFVLGITGALFMEHVTLYNLAISFLIIFYVFVRYRKVYITHIAFAVGALSGTVIMFTNTAYGLIAGSNDAQGGYRSTALGGGALSLLKDNAGKICDELFINNIPILIIMSTLLVFLAVNVYRKKKNILIFSALFVNIVSLMVIYAKNKYEYWFVALDSSSSELLTLVLIIGAVGMYCLSVLTLSWICVEDLSARFKMLLVLVSVVVVTAPLIVVSPISSRCFIPQYFLLMVYSVLLLDYLKKHLISDKSTTEIITAAVSAVLVGMVMFTFNVYGEIHHYAQKRDAYVQKQLAAGESIVKICEIPNSTYVYAATPINEMWEHRFKLFYGIDTDIRFEKMYYKDFDEWAKEYDKKETKK